MSRGHTISTCHACFITFMTGCAIRTVCFDCEQQGHTSGFFTDCPKCEEEKLEAYARWQQFKATHLDKGAA